MTAPRIVKRVSIRGRVQGVGFRAFVEEQAILRGLEGFVRNRRDGTVEAVFAGPPDVIGDILDACRAGPRSSRVDVVDLQDGAETDLASRRPGEIFSCLPTV